MTDTVVVGCKWGPGILMQLESKGVSYFAKGSNSSEVYGGHGITEDIPADFWSAWLIENKNHDLVTGGFIFAHEQRKEVKAQAKEKAQVKTKAEAITPPKGDEVK